MLIFGFFMEFFWKKVFYMRFSRVLNIWGLGFGVWGLGFGVLGFGCDWLGVHGCV